MIPRIAFLYIFSIVIWEKSWHCNKNVFRYNCCVIINNSKQRKIHHMKKMFFVAAFFATVICANAQQNLQKNLVDSSEVANNRAKLWLRAFDVGNVTTLQQLSAEGTQRCDLEYLVSIHHKEDSMIMWGKANWWTRKKDTICGIVGFMITPSFDLKPGETVKTGPNLPLFLHTNSKGKWVVNIYFSELDLIECPCRMTEAEKKKLLENN